MQNYKILQKCIFYQRNRLILKKFLQKYSFFKLQRLYRKISA
jgi:hypothetical protein